jgi:hypothetical protein
LGKATSSTTLLPETTTSSPTIISPSFTSGNCTIRPKGRTSRRTR